MVRVSATTGGFLVLAAFLLMAADTPPATTDLSRPFATRLAWRMAITQGPRVKDPGENDAPGEIRLCLQVGSKGACDPALKTTMRQGVPDDLFAEPHYLDGLRIQRLSDGAPLIVVDTSSVSAGDGDQVRLTQALAYRRDKDRFVRVYEHQTGRNNNQDTRFITAGPLKGDIISVDPTNNAPFGFWMAVNAPTPGGSSTAKCRATEAPPITATATQWR